MSQLLIFYHFAHLTENFLDEMGGCYSYCQLRHFGAIY